MEDDMKLSDLKKVPNEIDETEEFVKSLYVNDANIDMKTIYASPTDIARLHVIKSDFERHNLNRPAHVLQTFLNVLKPALVSKDGIGREQAKEMVNGLMTKRLSFSEKLITNLAKTE